MLRTGKYLNVIKESQQSTQCPFAEDLFKNYQKYIQIQDFTEPVMKAYEWANKQIIDLFYGDGLDLFGRIRSLKMFFLFEKGDFFMQFVECAEEELTKNFKQLSKEKLESLLEISLRTSTLSQDPYIDDLTIGISNYTLAEQLFAMQII